MGTVPKSGPAATLYFHSPCFDGIVSAVLTWDFAEAVLKWKVRELRPVNYQRRSSWLSERLSSRARSSTFSITTGDVLGGPPFHRLPLGRGGTRLRAEGQPYLIYDDTADACAKLLWDRFESVFQYRNTRYAELVSWRPRPTRPDTHLYGRQSKEPPGVTDQRLSGLRRGERYSAW